MTVADPPLRRNLIVSVLSRGAKDEQNVREFFAIDGIMADPDQVGSKNIFALVILVCGLLIIELYGKWIVISTLLN